jgi:carboxyl-terminal processing protease
VGRAAAIVAAVVIGCAGAKPASRAYLLLVRESVLEPPPRELAAAAMLGAGTRADEATDDIDANARRLARLSDAAAWQAVEAMVAFLDDPHVHLVSRARREAIGQAVRGVEHVAAGFGAHPLPGGDWVVNRVLPGSPAERAGLRVGERVTAVGGRRPSVHVGMDLLLVRPAGTRVALATSSGPRELVLGPVLPPLVEHRVERGAGILAIRAFTVPAAPPRDLVPLVEEALARFDAAGARGIVVDLRGNAGGFVDAAFRVASLLVDGDPIVGWRDRRESGHDRRVGAPWPTRRPVAVLVDEHTISAGEILAFALQARGARAFGRPTGGALNFPEFKELDADRALWIPTAWVVSPIDGRTARRVTPDGEIPNRSPDELLAGRDAQLDAAIAWLEARYLPAQRK